MEPLKCFLSQHCKDIKFMEIFVQTVSLNSHVYHRVMHLIKISSHLWICYFWKFSLLLFCFLSFSLPAVCTMFSEAGWMHMRAVGRRVPAHQILSLRNNLVEFTQPFNDSRFWGIWSSLGFWELWKFTQSR